MAKQSINVGTAANDKKGDSLRAAFQKVNANFTELYEAVGLADTGQDTALTFLGSTISTDDSSSIVIDQATTITSNLSVGGDLLPSTAHGGDLGSSTLPWRSLYVSNNTIFIGGTAVGLDANGNLTTGGTVVGSTPAWANITGKPTFATVATTGAYADLTGKPTIPTDFRGSVFADDSTLMIDAVDNKIYATELTVAVGNFVNVNSNNVDVENINGLSSQINFTVGGNNNLVIENNLVTIQNVSLSVAGDITLGGNIRSDSNINIDINLSDSTLRRWQFGEDGILTLPGGKVQVQASSSYGSIQGSVNTPIIVYSGGTTGQVSLQWTNADPENNVAATAFSGVTVNSGNTGDVKIITGAYNPMNGIFDKTWNFGTDGSLTLPNDSSIKSATNIDITIDTPDSSTFNWRFGADGDLTFPDGTSQSTAYTGGGGSSIPTVVTTGAVGVDGAAHAKVQFTVASATTVTAVGVTAIGVTDSTKGTITLSGSPATGAFNIVAVTNTFPGEFYIFIPFATNAQGTGYGAPISGEGTNPCLVRGTLITMADMSRVAVENITYSDDILVWDFDLGEFTSAKPLWIKKTQTTVVSCLLTFSDHSELRIVGDSPKAHRIFNKEAGKFTYGSMPETPIGTTTFNDQGEEITLISKEWIVGEVEFYNVMTDYHMNLFANSILTSMRYNNLYPITDMKFVKDSRTLRTADDYPNVEERLYKGFRLAEQTHGVEEIETHIQWLLTLEVERETECV